MKQAENIEEFKAYSQNMMHESMEIKDRLYGRLSGDDVKAVVTGTNLFLKIEKPILEKY